MTPRALGLAGRVTPPFYALLVPLVLLAQHLAVALCYRWAGERLELDMGFWLLPLRRLAGMPHLTSAMAASVFLLGFLVAWALAVLSFRRATWSNRGYWFSLFAIFPVLQIPAMAVLAILPRGQAAMDDPKVERIDLVDVMQGIIAGIGFLGAGTILKGDAESQVKGLTTAAGIWLTAAVGVAAGMGREATAVLSTLLALAILWLIPLLQELITRAKK